MVAASTVRGSQASGAASSTAATARKSAVHAPAQRVRAPASAFKALREKLPPTGMPLDRPATRFDAASPASSRRPSTCSPRCSPSRSATAKLLTKVTSAKSAAEGSSASQSSASSSGRPSGRWSVGRRPTTATPCDGAARAQASAMATAITTSGAERATSCAMSWLSQRAASRCRWRRASSSTASEPSPKAAVARCTAGPACAALHQLRSKARRCTPCAGLPSSAGSCESAIEIAAPTEKPCSTGALKSAASASSLSTAASASSRPTSQASTTAAALGSTWPASGAMACSVIRASTAAGPTALTLLAPTSAYATSGSTLAYRPTCGGSPASSA